MKALTDFLIGIVLAVLGAFIFLTNVTVSGFYSGFFSFTQAGRFHTGTTTMGMLVVLMCIFFFLMIIKPNVITKGLLIFSFLCFVASIILSLNFGFRRMNAFVLFAILALFVAGLAFIFKAVAGLEKAEKDAGIIREEDEK